MRVLLRRRRRRRWRNVRGGGQEGGVAMVPPQRDGVVAEEGAQPCVTAGVEGEARCVRAGGGGGRRGRGGEEDGEGRRITGDGREGGQRPPPPVRSAEGGRCRGGDSEWERLRRATPSPAPAWRCTMGI